MVSQGWQLKLTKQLKHRWFVQISSNNYIEQINMARQCEFTRSDYLGLLLSHRHISLSPCSSNYSWKKLSLLNTIAIRLCVNIPIQNTDEWFPNLALTKKDILLTILHEHLQTFVKSTRLEKLIWEWVGCRWYWFWVIDEKRWQYLMFYIV